MKCRNCGANAFFQDNFIECESCGNRYPIESTFEKIDVFICYVENDSNGRRTKDSIIAQEIYNNFNNAKINTFYERISAGNLLGDDFEQACYSAIYNAKIVLMVGTGQKYFEELIEKYDAVIKNKKIMPVCSDMNLATLPDRINKLQALNYDSVGASSDLTKSVLFLLGRQLESDNTKKQKKKTIIIIAICCILAVGLLIGGFFLFYGGKSEEPIDTEEVVVDSRPTDYELAQEYMEQEKYADAIKIFHGLGDYKNSKNMLVVAYEKYEGYYWDEASQLSMHLNVSDNRKASIEISCNVNGVIVRITESGEIEINAINFEYIDSENNSGKLSLLLENESVNMSLQPEEANGFSMKKKDIQFLMTQKTDKPHEKNVTKEILLGWLDNRISISEISRMGYELEEQGEMFAESRGESAYSYKIKNTEIELASANVDLTQGSYWGDTIEERVVFGIAAPARVVLPDRIGQPIKPVVSKGYLYAPEGAFLSSPGEALVLGGYYGESFVGKKIEADTVVCVISRKGFSEEIWNNILNSTMSSYEYMTNTSNNTSNSPMYILPFSSDRLLTYADVSQLTQEQLKLARNEIYARKGRIFNDSEMQSYFEAQGWYNGVIEPSDFTEDMLSEIERENVKFIMSYEQ